jgi:hypothetical protein
MVVYVEETIYEITYVRTYEAFLARGEHQASAASLSYPFVISPVLKIAIRSIKFHLHTLLRYNHLEYHHT